jgi:6-phosphofructokinase 1
MTNLKNLVVAQSGGPTAAINASLAGVIKGAMDCEKIGTVYGSKNGIDGILKDNLINLTQRFENNSDLDLLKITPAMALGSCRHKLRDYKTDESEYNQILTTLKKYNIGYFVYIGGNDSMDTTAKLSEFFKLKGEDINVIGVPKTIDNDLDITDHCPGFGSAAKFVATTLCEIVRDCKVYDVPAVTIVEIMGRNAGWLTASAALAKNHTGIAPQLIYLPEVVFDTDKFITDVKEALEKYKTVIVAISEGIKTANGKYVSESAMECKTDNFGHKYMAGAGKFLENLVTEKIGCKVRSVELNVLQRSAAHVLSKTDIDLAFKIGEKASYAVANGITGEMMAFKRLSSTPYECEIITCGVSGVANAEKKFPREWINEEGNDILPVALEYLTPLIEGEITYPTKNGLPVHFVF